jgi:hypothetical protein
MNPECVFDLSFFYSTFTPVRAGDKRQSQWTFILEKHKLHGNCTLIRLMLCDVILHWKVATKIFRVQGPAPRIQFVLQKDQRSERVYSSVTSVHTACKPCRCPQNKTTSRQQNKTKNISSTGPSPGSFARSSKTTWYVLLHVADLTDLHDSGSGAYAIFSKAARARSKPSKPFSCTRTLHDLSIGNTICHNACIPVQATPGSKVNFSISKGPSK